jgi:hypothetical protein
MLKPIKLYILIILLLSYLKYVPFLIYEQRKREQNAQTSDILYVFLNI